METKLDSRQAQFPATFPDTFKNFFEMMNEDEDHIDIFSNLLEDKVIPRASNNNVFAQRRCGGSLRCSTHPHSNVSSSSSSDMTSESLGSGMNTNTIRLDGRSGPSGSGIIVGRSNSFRINRARNSFCTTGLNKIGIVGEDSARCSGIGRGGGGGGAECGDAVGDGGGGIGSSLFCKHIKYCCLHQHNTQQQQQPSTLKSSSQQLYMQQQQPQRYHQQQYQHHPQHQQQQQKQQQPHNFNQKNYYDFSSNVVGTSHASNKSIALGSSATRLGPDGEDIASGGGGSGCGQSSVVAGDATSGGPAVKKNLLLLSDMTAAIKIRFQKQQTQTKTQIQQQQQQQQQKEEKQQLQKRHSVILERAFDFDVSCDESDTLSIQSPTNGPLLNATLAGAAAAMPTQPAPATSYTVLKPILVHTQQQQQLLPTEAPAPPLPPPTQALPTHVHRLLPQPPKNFGLGAFHTKETALQRVQQQSGLLSNATSKVNLPGCLHHASTSAEAAASAAQQQQAHYVSNDFSNYNSYQMDALHSPTAAPPPLPPPPTTTRQPHLQQLQQQQQQLVAGSVDASLLNAAHCSSSRATLNSIRCQKSPILHRRRSSSIAANLLHAGHVYTHNNSSSNITDDFGKHGDETSGGSMRDRITLAKSPASRFHMNSMMQLPIPVESGVLTFQQALSGAVSPQYSVTTPLLHMGAIGGNRTATETGEGNVNIGIGSISNRNLTEIAGSSTALASVLEDTNTSGADVSDDSPTARDAPLTTGDLHPSSGQFSTMAATTVAQQQQQQQRERAEGAGIPEHGSSVNVSHLGSRQRQRMRTSSMPAENRKPRLVDTRRAAIHCADIDMEYYRLRSFSITSHGVCHLGDSLRSRRSRSINSVTSTGTSNSGVDRHNSNASRTSDDALLVPGDGAGHQSEIPAYKIAMLGGSGVGKTTLTYQFTTSDYICAYDLSLDDDYGQKTVSVLVDNIETDLEVIDHPSCEMSTEAFCSTYNIDLFVVVYSVVDRSTFKAAEKVLHYLKENEMLLTRGAILVGNKTDLERHREVTRQMGRKVAKEIACKFIETSSGLDHNVDELLVGIVAQVKLNPQRIRNLSERDQQRLNLQSTIQKHRRMHVPQRRIVRQMSMFQDDDDDADRDAATASTSAAAAVAAAAPDTSGANDCDKATVMHADEITTASISATVAANVAKLHRGGVVRKPHRRTLNLESILKMGESELEDEEEAQRLQMQGLRAITKFELLTSGIKPPYTFARARSALRTPSNDGNPSHNESTSESTTDALLGAVGGSDNSGNSCNIRGHKTMTRLTTRTKILLSSVLRFKRAILIKRRNSSNCSDLFVI